MGVQCVACHNPVVQQKDSVVMPSGLELTGLGDEARCMECHQGRESSVSVNARILEAAGVEDFADVDLDAVTEGLGFANIHYYAAAATKYGTLAKGGYEYAGQTYDGNFAHVEEFDTCIECHSPHTLEVQVDSCVMCHGDGEPATFRMESSAVDYDGDGDWKKVWRMRSPACRKPFMLPSRLMLLMLQERQLPTTAMLIPISSMTPMAMEKRVRMRPTTAISMPAGLPAC